MTVRDVLYLVCFLAFVAAVVVGALAIGTLVFYAIEAWKGAR